MRRFLALSLSTAITLVLLAVPASAAAPKFHSTSSAVTNTGALSVSFDERGLGNGDVDYTVVAQSSAVWACINGGGKNPSAANKRTVNSPVTAAGTFQAKNGRITATLTTSAPTAGTFTCPSGQRLVLVRVTYTDIVLRDTTNGVRTDVPDASRTFYNL